MTPTKHPTIYHHSYVRPLPTVAPWIPPEYPFASIAFLICSIFTETYSSMYHNMAFFPSTWRSSGVIDCGLMQYESKEMAMEDMTHYA